MTSEPKQRAKQIKGEHMANYLAVVAIEGAAPIGIISVDLSKCAIYRLEDK